LDNNTASKKLKAIEKKFKKVSGYAVDIHHSYDSVSTFPFTQWVLQTNPQTFQKCKVPNLKGFYAWIMLGPLGEKLFGRPKHLDVSKFFIAARSEIDHSPSTKEIIPERKCRRQSLKSSSPSSPSKYITEILDGVNSEFAKMMGQIFPVTSNNDKFEEQRTMNLQYNLNKQKNLQAQEKIKKKIESVLEELQMRKSIASHDDVVKDLRDKCQENSSNVDMKRRLECVTNLVEANRSRQHELVIENLQLLDELQKLKEEAKQMDDLEENATANTRDHQVHQQSTEGVEDDEPNVQELEYEAKQVNMQKEHADLSQTDQFRIKSISSANLDQMKSEVQAKKHNADVKTAEKNKTTKTANVDMKATLQTGKKGTK
jgi:hypothetical protein